MNPWKWNCWLYLLHFLFQGRKGKGLGDDVFTRQLANSRERKGPGCQRAPPSLPIPQTPSQTTSAESSGKKEEKQIPGPEGKSMDLQVRRAVCSHRGPPFQLQTAACDISMPPEEGEEGAKELLGTWIGTRNNNNNLHLFNSATCSSFLFPPHRNVTFQSKRVFSHSPSPSLSLSFIFFSLTFKNNIHLDALRGGEGWQEEGRGRLSLEELNLRKAAFHLPCDLSQLPLPPNAFSSLWRGNVKGPGFYKQKSKM